MRLPVFRCVRTLASFVKMKKRTLCQSSKVIKERHHIDKEISNPAQEKVLEKP